jgi:hypothetical protein
MYRKSNFYLFCPLKHKIRILQPSAQNGLKLKIQSIKFLVDLSLIAYSRCAGLLCGGDFTTAVVCMANIEIVFLLLVFSLEARNLWAPVDFPKTSPQVIGRNSASV